MRYIRRAMLVLTLAAAVTSTMVATTAPASAGTKQTCAQVLGITLPTGDEAAAKTPVILVHGLWSKASMWSEGSPSMVKMINSVGGANALSFDYQSANSDWVATGDTAHRLAETIVCYSKLYGGKKVIIVAHSMGGLLTRAALSQAAFGTFAKDVTGHVITIATPNTGAAIAGVSYYADMSLCNATFMWWGSDAQDNCRQIEGNKAVVAMTPGSPELQALPRFPRGVTVKAIAGEVSRQVCAPWGCSPTSTTGGDLVVSVQSATDEFTTTGAGDGKTIFACTDPVAIPNISHPWCEHNSLTKAPQVQAEVKKSIEAYFAVVSSVSSIVPVANASKLTSGVTLDLFGRATITMSSAWTFEFGKPGLFMNYTDQTNCPPSATCRIHFINLASGQAGTPGKTMAQTWAEGACGGQGDADEPTTVMLRGVQANVYRQLCPGGGASYLWLIPSRQLYIDAEDGVDASTVEAALEQITWR